MRRWLRELVPLAPIAVFVALFALIPVGLLFASSLSAAGGLGGLGNLLALPLNQRSLANSLVQGGLSAVLAVAFGYPAGVFLGRYRWPGREVVRSLLLVPFLLPSLIVVLGVEDLFGAGRRPRRAVPFAGVLRARDSRDHRSELGLQRAPRRPSHRRRVRDRCSGVRGDRGHARRLAGPSVPRRVGTVDLDRGGRGGLADIPVLRALVRPSAPPLRGAVLHGRGPDLVPRSDPPLPVGRGGARLRHGRAVPGPDGRLPLPGPAVVPALRAKGLRGAAPRLVGGDGRPGRRDRGRSRRGRGSAGGRDLSDVQSIRRGWTGLGLVCLVRSGDGTATRDRDPAATANTLLFAVAAAGITVVLAVPAAYAVLRRPGRSYSLGLLLFVPLLLSPVVLALSLATFWRPLLGGEGSVWALVIVSQTVLALPFALQSLGIPLAGLSAAGREAAESLGAGRFSAFLDADLPRVRDGLVTASLFAFALGLGEFTATYFLVTPRFTTLPVALYGLIGTRQLPVADAAAGLLLLLSLVVFLALSIGGRRVEL